ncbi:MAG: ATP-binding cassette domain-containing protein [Angelakisella sp.]|jgi:peptide/nickel transport system ATP-binding protein|nr:ATP-binding cassette domain-containing protein [Angelakisella sp.]
MSGQRKKLLELRKLKKYFPVRRGVAIKAVEDVTFSIYEGEKFGVVGESGCGKSTLGRVILQLYPQTSGACIYYGQTRDEMCPQYLAKEVARITDYQRKATEFYQKSLVLQKKADALRVEADALSAMGTDREVKKEARLQKRLSELEFQAHELRKDASRQLREGSRTVGSLILCKDLPKVQELFTQAQKETVAASAAIKKYREYEKQAAEAEVAGKPDPALRDRMETAKREAVAHRDTAHGLRQKAFDDYRGKDILPITERTQDPAYQDKLDRNYETGINLGKLTREEMRELRREMQMIFQDPAASLDPRQTVGKSIEEVFVINTDLPAQVRKEKTMELLEKVGLKREHYWSYPNTLSGGQKQRVGIARAIALDTKFVVLDESVSALDVSVQAQILQLLGELSAEKHLTYFFITHDLGVVKHFCDRILVMYLGNVCELAESAALFHNPLHPYTQSLLAAVPRLRVGEEHSTESVLEGDVPSAMNPPKGCPFHTRCSQCMEICGKERPPVVEAEPGHFVACHLFDK